jgi:hypothetical protein
MRNPADQALVLYGTLGTGADDRNPKPVRSP